LPITFSKNKFPLFPLIFCLLLWISLPFLLEEFAQNIFHHEKWGSVFLDHKFLAFFGDRLSFFNGGSNEGIFGFFWGRDDSGNATLALKQFLF
jgi:hypothetical protein